MNYVLDTNIITTLMKNNRNIKNKLQKSILSGNEILINGISYYEIRRGLLAANAPRKLSVFNNICKQLGMVLLDSLSIFDKASEIYADLKQRGKLIEDADILIAAVALEKEYILISDNSKHFQRINNISLENWM